jgi:hypothetical protein
MNAYQLFVGVFGFFSLALAVWAVWCVAKAEMRHKTAWIVGSLFGFCGFGLNWTKPDHLILLFGVQIPPLIALKVLSSGVWTVKAMFPFIALVALGKSKFGQAKQVVE